MIILKGAAEIAKMRESAKIAAHTMDTVLAAAKEGVTTKQLDKIAYDEIIKYGEMIGRTNCRIPKGCHVNEHNIFSVPRDYDSELV